MQSLDRRRFLTGSLVGLGALASGCQPEEPRQARPAPAIEPEPREPLILRRPYTGPNVVVIRFGGGVRRRETVESPERTFCPFIYHELGRKQGVIYPKVDMASAPAVVTSHGQGTLYLLTGRYDHYEDITHKPLAERFEPAAPTLFEYFRREYDVPEHQTLLINGEDRIDEDFYTFSNHHLYGAHYRSTVLSLYRYKTFLLREQLRPEQRGRLGDQELAAVEEKLREMEARDYRAEIGKSPCPELDQFWTNWRNHYGKTGLVNPRGDRLLTTLAIRALHELRPRLMMINYQDPDYVHWGNSHFYTRAISIIDDGVRQLYEAAQADEAYRNNTAFLIVPDCGRDNNRCAAVPFQHHFNSMSAHEIFAVLAGPGIAKSAVLVDRTRQQISLTATVGKLMNFSTPHVDAEPFVEALA